jgi:hypothetical protein
VRQLRGAVEHTVATAKWGDPRFTPNKVGSEVIDLIDGLNSRALAVLHVVVGELVRQSQNGTGYRN